MNSSEIKVVFLKELKEVLRDYRTLLMMIVIPTIFYPFFLVFPATLAQNTLSDIGKSTMRLAVVGECPPLYDFFRNEKQFVVRQLKESDVADAIKRGAVDVALLVPAELKTAIEQPPSLPSVVTDSKKSSHPQIKIVFDTSKESVLFGMSKLYKALNQFEKECVRKRLRAIGIGDDWQNKLEVIHTDVASGRVKKSNVLAQSVPYLMVLMILIATMYPALDLITGERQRGTMALLLVAPVARHTIMYGKILVVVLVGIIATLMGLTSIFATVSFPEVQQFFSHSDMRCEIGPASALGVASMTIPLTIFISSLSIYVAAWTRSFQQGQGYFLPVVIFGMLMASAAHLPDASINSIAAFVPVANTALCIKDILEGVYNWPWILVVFLSSTAYAVLLTRAAVSLLEREDLLFGVQQSPRIRVIKGDYIRELVVFGGVVFMLLFYLGQIATMGDPLIGNALTQIFLIMIPALFFLKWHKMPVAETLSLRCPSSLHILGALVLSVATVFLANLMLTTQSVFMPYSEEYAKQMMLLIIPPDKPLWQILLVVAVLPGICEEVLFRGLVQGVLMKRYPRDKVIVWIGILFGVFHLSLFRFLPTASLGMVISYLVFRSGSIFPSMCLHMAHNGLYVLAVVNKWDLVSTQFAILAGLALFICFLLFRDGKQATPGKGGEAIGS